MICAAELIRRGRHALGREHHLLTWVNRSAVGEIGSPSRGVRVGDVLPEEVKEDLFHRL